MRGQMEATPDLKGFIVGLKVAQKGSRPGHLAGFNTEERACGLSAKGI
jgi:hypothetical protein